MSDNLVILTFDEATRDHPTNKVTTVLLGDSVKAGSATDSCYDHYDLLRTVQDTLGLGHLGRKDAESNVIEGIWKERVAVPE
jgi:phosphatidylinositol-3-phosphatase